MVSVFAALQAGTPAPAESGVVAYLTTISAIGVIAMALIQTAKDMFPVRRWFQAARFRAWMRQGLAEARATGRPALVAVGDDAVPDRAMDPDQRIVWLAERRIVSLATDGDAHALYDLPIEQMCGQINAAMQVVLEYPARDRNVVAIVASQVAPADLDVLFGADSAAAGNGPSPSAAAEAKTRVMQQFQRAIDAFQIAASYRWKLWMQLASLALCGALTLVALSMNFHMGADRVGSLGAVVVGAVLAGFLAPVARDLTAAIQSLRK